jgi:predicted ATPase
VAVIEKVQFRNFKAYRSLDLELEPFTVLVGPNASGKTTLLEGLGLVAHYAGMAVDDPHLDSITEEVPGIQSYGTTAPVELGVVGRWAATPGSFKVTNTPADKASAGTQRKLGPDDRTSRFSGTWAGGPLPKSLGERPSLFASGGEQLPSVEPFRKGLSSTAVLRFEPKRLAEASYSDEPVPRVRSDGTGLASVLAYLKLSHDEVFNDIELALKQVVPAVRRVRIERAEVEQTAIRTIALDEQRHEVTEKRALWGNQIVLDMKGAKAVSASAAGEGTLMVLGLLTVLMGPTKPRLVLLDDIELSLHPAAQRRLVEALRAIQKRDPELQIVATSHSPFILNYLDPKEVRMIFLAENGFARCEKLTAHPEYEKWKDLMAPGEFWSTVGEEWIGKLGGAAVNE